MGATPKQLAERAVLLYRPDNAQVTAQLYREWILEAYRLLVHEVGNLYIQTAEISIVPGTYEYALPTDLRRLRPSGVYFYYAPRSISAISRSNDIVTVVTETAHMLSAGVQIVISDVTPDSFNGTFAVSGVADSTTFVYEQVGDNQAGSGGQVGSAATDEVYLSYRREPLIVGQTGWSRTTGSPTYYFFPTAASMALNPVPDGSYPVLVLRYDAEAPAVIGDDEQLPVPDYVDPALIAYAHSKAAILAKDGAARDMFRLEYEVVRNRWAAAIAQRQQVAAASVIGEDDQVNLNDAEA